MTQLSNSDQAVRRYTDGSIDFDFYRTRSVAIRRQALQDTAKLKTVLMSVLAAAACVGVLFVAAAPAPVMDATCHRCTPAIVAGADLAGSGSTPRNTAMTAALPGRTALTR